jgi:FADH2-dependent halogenase
MRESTGPRENLVLADFSYNCSPFAGPGYFLVGDAACFLDPIFSTGVTLAMVSAAHVSGLVAGVLRGEIRPHRAYADHRRFVSGSTDVFWRLIRGFYKHSFRELFMNGSGPLRVHQAVIATLGGQVFPKPCFALRWRLRLFEFFVWAQRYVPLVPRRPVFSLIAEQPAEVDGLSHGIHGIDPAS